MSEFALEIKGLKKTYQSKKSENKEALKSIDLNIKRGSFFGLLGPNGAGKSTIINIIAGLVKKSSGLVKVCGHDIDNDLKKAKFKLGIVPQELIIDPFFSVYEALDIYAGYYGIRKKDRRTIEIIEALGLKDQMSARPRSLSGGMKRRLLVAKALVHNPELLILDEPTAGVDVELRTQLWDYVKKLNQENKTTILLTTHYLEEAEELCDDIAIIDKGRVVVNDTKKEIVKTLDGKQLQITTKNNIKLIPKSIEDNFESKIVDNNNLIIEYSPKKTNISDILAILNKEKIEIADILTKQADLEDVFKFLVKK
ncbi:ABC transporter ATP-binding protein [Rickettsiales bacterium]|nr:ABC transporter ATP-binding protein [Rickettsiales bacterium]